MYNIISKTKYSYFFSGILVILSIACLFAWGLKLGIDFTGGTLMEVKFSKDVPNNQALEEILQDQNLKSLTLQPTENNSVIIRYASEDDSVNQSVLKKIQEKYPESVQLRVDYINSTVSKELKKKSLWAIFWLIRW